MAEFKISAIGDVSKREVLGPTVGVEMFRILRTAMVNLISTRLGKEQAKEAIYLSGKAVGGEIAKAFLSGITDLEEYVNKLAEILKSLKVGLVKVLETDVEGGKFVVRVDECASCSGTPVIGEPICDFEGGIIAGVLKYFLGKEVKATEVKCWAMGDQTCEFVVVIEQ
jgi:predicted hydrocarbon binding protein